jgi:hypothetical protein
VSEEGVHGVTVPPVLPGNPILPNEPVLPSSPVVPSNPVTPSLQVWDLGFSGTSTGPTTVTLHFDAAAIDSRQLGSLSIDHFTGGTWQLPGQPIKIDLTADTITFQTDSFSPFMLVAVAEPSTLPLLGIGALGLAAASLRNTLVALRSRQRRAV